MSIVAADIESVYRARSNMIIVKFVNLEVKLKILTAKKNKKATLGDIPSVSNSSNDAAKEIFINTQVTPFVGRLLHRGRIAVREKKIVACWMSAVSILVKITLDGEPIAIKSMEDFDGILGKSDALEEPIVTPLGKRRISETSPQHPIDQNPKSKQKINLRGRSSVGPISSKIKSKINKQIN